MQRLLVVGGGFSGAAVAIHLSRLAGSALEIVVVDPKAAPGHGLAHGTPHPQHRLNAPAAIHTIHPEAPLHFAEWVRDQGLHDSDPDAMTASGGMYARRFDFGRYMAGEGERHARANPSGSRIEHVRGVATRLRRTAAGIEVELADGRAIAGARCVLAVGWNDVGVPAPLRAVDSHAGWFADPWHAERLATLDRHTPVLLVGAGLTASDTFAALAAQGHQAPVLALSRRGLRPATQTAFASTRSSVWDLLRDPSPSFLRRHGRPTTLRGLVRTLREDIAAIDPSRASWHEPFDELRDAVTTFWPDLPTDEKRRFVRQLKPWYDAFRFRNPPQVERIVEAGVARGQLVVAAGRLATARTAGAAIEIAYNERAGGARRTVRVGAVVNCTGPQARPGASNNPLWRSLISEGLARDHPCGVGIDVDTACRTLDARGRPNEDLFAIGPPTAGAFGESTGAPYVVRQILDAMAPVLLAPARARTRGPAAFD